MKLIFAIFVCFFSCSSGSKIVDHVEPKIRPGAYDTKNYLPKLLGKKIAITVNHTSFVRQTHLIDTLLSLSVNVVKAFTPEHGITGNADAGEHVGNSQSGNVTIYSLYGDQKKPSKSDLSGVDIMIFDIQDVGVRFYTYLSTLHYVMEACAENSIPLILLDRPNPNGYYIDGPVLKPQFKSFVGMHPVPVVYGMTIGEYAQMINGEGWLNNKIKCDLTVIKCQNYTHDSVYELPIKPSPNLPNMRSILLYPSLCFFEGTEVSVGRGTQNQFQVIGHPGLSKHYSYAFTPVKTLGSKYPPQENQKCFGLNLQTLSVEEIRSRKALDLDNLIRFYHDFTKEKLSFFLENNFFEKLAGDDQLRKQIIAGYSNEQIRQSWQSGLNEFKQTREKYVLYH